MFTAADSFPVIYDFLRFFCKFRQYVELSSSFLLKNEQELVYVFNFNGLCKNVFVEMTP